MLLILTSRCFFRTGTTIKKYRRLMGRMCTPGLLEGTFRKAVGHVSDYVSNAQNSSRANLTTPKVLCRLDPSMLVFVDYQISHVCVSCIVFHRVTSFACQVSDISDCELSRQPAKGCMPSRFLLLSLVRGLLYVITPCYCYVDLLLSSVVGSLPASSISCFLLSIVYLPSLRGCECSVLSYTEFSLEAVARSFISESLVY